MSKVEYIPPVDSWIWFPRMNIEPFQNETEPKLYPHAYVKMVDISILESAISIIKKQDEALKFISNGCCVNQYKNCAEFRCVCNEKPALEVIADNCLTETAAELKRLGVTL